MNSYLEAGEKVQNPFKKQQEANKTTQQSQQSQIYLKQQLHLEIENQLHLNRTKSEESGQRIKQKDQGITIEKGDQKKTLISSKTASLTQNSNFYQTYINLFVNFFNKNFDTVNLNSIKSIIRPNNRFVLIDLLKALLEFARNDFKVLLKITTFYHASLGTMDKIKILRTNTQTESNDYLLQEQGEKQLYLTNQEEIKDKRRIHTQPQINSPKSSIKQIRKQIDKISPTKPFRTKNTTSTANFAKSHTTEINRFKIDEAEELNNRYLHAHFIQYNIKQSIYEKSLEFVNQINLQKLQTKANNIYFELQRLNCGNAQIVSSYYEQTFGKKTKFNYDSRGLYSESEIQAKKSLLIQEIEQFQRKLKPNPLSNSVQLVEYSQSYTKYKHKQEQLDDLIRERCHISNRSTWIPLSIQFTTSIIQPLKIEIEETNLITGQVFSYHWKKYKKQFSICDYFKQRLKSSYQKTQSRQPKIKNGERESFKKQKFRKSNFLDNRKKVNQLLQSNNIITTKKESIFPLLKGIQQNFIKNNNTNSNLNSNNVYALDNNLARNKVDQDQRIRSNVSTSKSSFQIPDSSQKQKRFDSIKRTFDVRLQRKQSESQKFLQKVVDKEKTELLSKLSIRYDLPERNSTRKIGQKYEKKSLISISRVIDIRGQINSKESPSNIKNRQNMVSNSSKNLNVLNMM